MHRPPLVNRETVSLSRKQVAVPFRLVFDKPEGGKRERGHPLVCNLKMVQAVFVVGGQSLETETRTNLNSWRAKHGK